MAKHEGNMYRNTSFRHGGRRAGSGVSEDRYDEESGGKHYRERLGYGVKFPHDGTESKNMNGPVICYKQIDGQWVKQN